MNNPLLEKFNTPHGAIPFNIIKEEHYLPALKEAITIAKKKLQALKDNNDSVTFENTIVCLEESSEEIDLVGNVFGSIHHAHASDELRKVAEDFYSLLSDYSNDVILDEKLFARIKDCYDRRASFKLTAEQDRFLDKNYKDFIRNGALLDTTEKEVLRKIDSELAALKVKYSDNVLNATNAFELWVDKKEDLQGLPEAVIEMAAESAKEKGKENSWLFTLQAPSFGPFLKYCQNRDLRKQMVIALRKRAYLDKFDNSQIVKDIASLRYKRADLLGYASHAHFVLEERMAGNPETVIDFINDFKLKASDLAKSELQQVKDVAKKLDNLDDFASWDSSYYSEIYKKQQLNFDDELLRPYFELGKVFSGMFELANRLYGIKLEEAFDIPKYHDDVQIFKVTEADGTYLGLLYLDCFPRVTKQGGGWMNELREQGLFDGEIRRPHIGICCNFRKAVGGKPSLLSFGEVTTIFHEFGHALHGLLSNCTYRSSGGTSVYWDFVELPSQIMENWAYEKECLDLFAVHYETGEKIPQEYLESIQKQRQFLEGWTTMAQMQYSYLDICWHKNDPMSIQNIEEFEEKVTKDYSLLPKIPGTSFSCSFSHIFAGGYSSGYYSYKWAEVLDADAFELFAEKGLFSREVGQSFRDNILSKGDSEHPMVLYKRFRGKEPTVDALLKRSGLK